MTAAATATQAPTWREYAESMPENQRQAAELRREIEELEQQARAEAAAQQRTAPMGAGGSGPLSEPLLYKGEPITTPKRKEFEKETLSAQHVLSNMKLAESKHAGAMMDEANHQICMSLAKELMKHVDFDVSEDLSMDTTVIRASIRILKEIK